MKTHNERWANRFWKGPKFEFTDNRQKIHALLPIIVYVRRIWIMKFVISGVALYVLKNDTLSLISKNNK